MNVNWSTIAAGAAGFLTSLEELAPVASAVIPGSGAVATIIAGAAKIADSLATAAENAGEAVAPADLASLQATNARIQELNDAAAEAVAAS